MPELKVWRRLVDGDDGGGGSGFVANDCWEMKKIKGEI